MRCLRHSGLFATVSALMLLAGLTGCGGGSAQPGTTAAPSPAKGNPTATEVAATAHGDTTSPATLESGAPLTDAECKRFGEVLADSMNANDIVRLNQLIDWSGLLATAIQGVPASDELQKTFTQEALGVLDTENGFWPQVINQAGAGTSDIARFLHVHGAGEKRAVLVRIILPESVAYLDVAICRRGEQIKGADIFSFLSGELVSQSIRRAYVINAASQSPAAAAQLKGWEHDLAASIPTLEAMTATLPAKPQEWLAAYGKLPETLRTDKNIMLTRIDVAKLTTDEAFATAVTEFKTVHAADPSTDLVLLNLYVQAQQHAEALETLKRLDAFVGGDPYLAVWKGNVMLALGKSAEARAEVAAAIKQEPTLRHGLWALVLISLAEHKYAETVSLLDSLEQNFKVEFDDLAQHPEYAEFLKSAEYNTWARTRSAQKPPVNSLR